MKNDFTSLDFVGGIVAAAMIWLPMWAGASAPRPAEPAAAAAAQPPAPEPQAPTLTSPATPDATSPPPT